MQILFLFAMVMGLQSNSAQAAINYLVYESAKSPVIIESDVLDEQPALKISYSGVIGCEPVFTHKLGKMREIVREADGSYSSRPARIGSVTDKLLTLGVYIDEECEGNGGGQAGYVTNLRSFLNEIQDAFWKTLGSGLVERFYKGEFKLQFAFQYHKQGDPEVSIKTVDIEAKAFEKKQVIYKTPTEKKMDEMHDSTQKMSETTGGMSDAGTSSDSK